MQDIKKKGRDKERDKHYAYFNTLYRKPLTIPRLEDLTN